MMSSESIIGATLIILAMWNKIILDTFNRSNTTTLSHLETGAIMTTAECRELKYICLKINEFKKLKVFCACLSKDHNFCLNFWYWIKILFCRHVIDGVKVWSNCQVKKSHFRFAGIFFADIQQSWDAFVIHKICKTSYQRTSEMIILCKSELKILIHCNLIKTSGERRLVHR